MLSNNKNLRLKFSFPPGFRREVSTAEGIDLAKELEADFFEVSAKDGYNIEQVHRRLFLLSE